MNHRRQWVFEHFVSAYESAQGQPLGHPWAPVRLALRIDEAPIVRLRELAPQIRPQPLTELRMPG